MDYRTITREIHQVRLGNYWFDVSDVCETLESLLGADGPDKAIFFVCDMLMKRELLDLGVIKKAGAGGVYCEPTLWEFLDRLILEAEEWRWSDGN